MQNYLKAEQSIPKTFKNILLTLQGYHMRNNIYLICTIKTINIKNINFQVNFTLTKNI